MGVLREVCVVGALAVASSLPGLRAAAPAKAFQAPGELAEIVASARAYAIERDQDFAARTVNASSGRRLASTTIYAAAAIYPTGFAQGSPDNYPLEPNVLWFGNNAFQLSTPFFGTSLAMTPDATKFVVSSPAFNFAQLGKIVGNSVLLTTPQTSLLPVSSGTPVVPDWTGFPRVASEVRTSTDGLEFANADTYVDPAIDEWGYNGAPGNLRNSFLYGKMGYDFGRSVVMSADGNTVVVGSSKSNVAMLYKGCKAWKCAHTFTFSPPSTAGVGDAFGWSIALSKNGKNVAIGAPGAEKVYVWSCTAAGTCVDPPATIGYPGPTAAEPSYFGAKVYLSPDGKRLIASATRYDHNSLHGGYVFTFIKSDGDSDADDTAPYTLRDSLEPVNTAGTDNFGFSFTVAEGVRSDDDVDRDAPGNNFLVAVSAPGTPFNLFGGPQAVLDTEDNAGYPIVVFKCKADGSCQPKSTIPVAPLLPADAFNPLKCYNFGADLAFANGGKTLVVSGFYVQQDVDPAPAAGNPAYHVGTAATIFESEDGTLAYPQKDVNTPGGRGLISFGWGDWSATGNPTAPLSVSADGKTIMLGNPAVAFRGHSSHCVVTYTHLNMFGPGLVPPSAPAPVPAPANRIHIQQHNVGAGLTTTATETTTTTTDKVVDPSCVYALGIEAVTVFTLRA